MRPLSILVFLEESFSLRYDHVSNSSEEVLANSSWNKNTYWKSIKTQNLVRKLEGKENYLIQANKEKDMARCEMSQY